MSWHLQCTPQNATRIGTQHYQPLPLQETWTKKQSWGSMRCWWRMSKFWKSNKDMEISACKRTQKKRSEFGTRQAIQLEHRSCWCHSKLLRTWLFRMKRVSVIQFAMLFDTPAKKMITFVCPVGRFLKTVIQDGINTNRDLPVWGSFGKEHMAWNPLLNLSPHHSWWISYLIVSYLHTYPPTNTWIQSFYKSMLMQAIFSVGDNEL